VFGKHFPIKEKYIICFLTQFLHYSSNEIPETKGPKGADFLPQQYDSVLYLLLINNVLKVASQVFFIEIFPTKLSTQFLQHKYYIQNL